METQDSIGVIVEVSVDDATPDDLDRMTRNLLGELRETDVESAELVSSGPAPAGAKSADPVTVGAIAVAVLPNFLPKLVDLVQSWAARGRGRAVKFKGKVGGRVIEFEGSSEDLQKLISTLSKAKKK